MARMTLICLPLTFFLLTVSAAQAQQREKFYRVGYLSTSPVEESFRQRLRELGYVEGKRLPDLLAKLVSMKVDIIIAGGDSGARAAKTATRTIPVVMVSVGTDPVETGLVESLARPGGNITGFTNLTEVRVSKRLELFKEAIPKLDNVAVLYDATSLNNLLEIKELQISARPLSLTVHSWPVRGAEDFDGAFTEMGKKRPGGLYLPASGLMRSNWKQIVVFAVENRLPSMCSASDAVDAGALMSYAPDAVDQYRRAATDVDKILKGTKPADLPVERPVKFELVINLKTAKQIGLAIPPNVLARADRVIR
jgi:putative tryptophan/tyrosine transport system substrate-binding protein